MIDEELFFSFFLPSPNVTSLGAWKSVSGFKKFIACLESLGSHW